MTEAAATRTSALEASRIAALLRTTHYGRSLQILPRTASTNDDARRAAEAQAASGHVVTAEAQSAGRGSHGRSWSSPAGTDLYVSILDRPAVAAAALPPLTLAVGLAVAATVRETLAMRAATTDHAARVAIKWPNDVWIGARKCAGILVEAQAGADARDPLAVVIGIGLNVNRAAFPPELEGAATSLRLCDPERQMIDRNAVLARLLGHVEAQVQAFVEKGPAPLATAVQPHLLWRGEAVQCGAVSGTLVGLSPSGALRLQNASGVHEVVSGRLEAQD